MKSSPLVLIASALLCAASSARAESSALNELRLSARAAAFSAYAPTAEGAAAANQRWAENGGTMHAAQSVVKGGTSGNAPGLRDAEPAPNLAIQDYNIPEAKPSQEDPLPPKIRGWQGFKLGFLGVEGVALAFLSKTGKATIPLMIVLQPIILPIALVVGLLGIFGIRL